MGKLCSRATDFATTDSDLDKPRSCGRPPRGNRALGSPAGRMLLVCGCGCGVKDRAISVRRKKKYPSGNEVSHSTYAPAYGVVADRKKCEVSACAGFKS